MNSSDVLNTYLKIILEFTFELYIFYFLVFFALPKKKNYLIYFVGGLVILLGILFGISALYVLIGESILGRIAIYFVIFALSYIHMCLVFKEGKWLILLLCSFSYGFQNIMYKGFVLLWSIIEQSGVVDSVNGKEFDLIYRLVYYGFILVFVLLSYFLFIKRFSKKIRENNFNIKMLLLALFALSITIVMCSIDDITFRNLSTIRENHFDNINFFVLRITSCTFSIICLGFIIQLLSSSFEKLNLSQELSYLEYEISQKEQQYNISKETIDAINIKYHDLKYQINSLLNKESKITKEEVDSLNEAIKLYDTKINTGNELLDVLLQEKAIFCKQNNIIFSCLVNGESFKSFNNGDLYCLFGNIIDNALEAVQKIEDPKKRVINIKIHSVNNFLIISEENYYEGKIEFSSKGLPKTTKENKLYHGFGTRSIQMIIKKYNGESSIDTKDNIYRLNIIFPIEKI